VDLPLKYPSFDIKIKRDKNQTLVFDFIRKKWLVLTPEEWVRQHVLNFLVTEKHFSASSISVEKELQLNQQKKRYDIVVYKNLKPYLIVECKAPYVSLDELVLEQALRYNLILRAPYLMISNGVSDIVFDAANQPTSF
jgi:hypothetical protein